MFFKTQSDQNLHQNAPHYDIYIFFRGSMPLNPLSICVQMELFLHENNHFIFKII